MNISGTIKTFRDERGQALVEFALIFTLLVVLLFGIAEFGRGWYYANALSTAARDGARYASLQPKGADFATRVHDYTYSNMTASFKPKTTDQIYANVSAFSKSTNASKAFANLSSGDAVTVIVGYRMIVVTGQIVPAMSGTKTIVRKATMRYEGS